MKVAVINGTEVKGCTYRMKELFLEDLRAGNEIVEFYLPRDLPEFCCGCKTCFFKGEQFCPHSKHTMPIWHAILEADLLVFAYPVYVLRTPGQMKALLDHFGCHWMVHRPNKLMFSKQAVILTQSIGAPNGAAQRDVATSLTWLGVPRIKRFGFGTMGSVTWDEIDERRRRRIEGRLKRLSKRYISLKPVKRGIKTRTYFFISRMLHKQLLKNEVVPSVDSQHWIDNGWL
jgi:multimeric flavodoxin WrbA